MIYLSGCVNAYLDQQMPPNCGWMFQPAIGNIRPLGRVWAADNGCYAAGERFDEAKWLTWLATRDRSDCLFAVAPDVVQNAAATLIRSTPHLTAIRTMGYHAAFVAQDGWDSIEVPWDEFDCLFVGGSTHFKLSRSQDLTASAHARGKWVHVGRVNSERRLRAMEAYGVDSVDGTYLAFGPDQNVIKLNRWFSAMERQPLLL